MSSSFTPDMAGLIGVQVETALYGVYLAMFPLTLYVLLTRKRNDPNGNWDTLNKVLVVSGILLFLLVTANWVIDQSRLWTSFIVLQHEPNGPERFWSLLDEPRSIARSIIWLFEVLVLDGLLLYRLYVIWNRNWWIMLAPGLSVLATAGVGARVSQGWTKAPLGIPLWKTDFWRWVVTIYALTLFTNAFAVGAITFRIIVRDRKLRSIHGEQFSRVILIMVESAGIYCLVNIATMVALVTHTMLNTAIWTFASPIAGISFNLITLRVGLAKTFRQLAPPTSEPFISTVTSMMYRPSGSIALGPVGSPPRSPHVSMPLQVRITKGESVMINERYGFQSRSKQNDRDVGDTALGWGSPRSP